MQRSFCLYIVQKKKPKHVYFYTIYLFIYLSMLNISWGSLYVYTFFSMLQLSIPLRRILEIIFERIIHHKVEIKVNLTVDNLDNFCKFVVYKKNLANSSSSFLLWLNSVEISKSENRVLKTLAFVKHRPWW